ncbi:MAG: chorismate synthase [Spirochaetales bacterium]|nr:chorismate synthase [Spirochaetales bacterium]MDY5916249.1 chorismate synthase [Treponema sp.]MDY5918338.1 chorismate synthase [Treponema sp.]
MKNTLGENFCVTIFGESHGPYIGVVLDGIAPGIDVNKDFINHQLDLRRPSGKISTKRVETDEFILASGVFNDKTTGTPLTILIPNSVQHSKDYEKTATLARPGHADYTANVKYHGFQDFRGGGHFSGRITAALVAAGGIIIPELEKKGIKIGTHIKSLGGIKDRNFEDYQKDIDFLGGTNFPVLDADKSEQMKTLAEKIAAEGDSVGGVLESVILGMPAGVGEPWFGTLESELSYALFSIPAIKGVQFGDGFDMVDSFGSEFNDSLQIIQDNGKSKVITKTNHNGGINGGISNGMPILFRCAVKPTPSIYKTQDTIDMSKNENAKLNIQGRHDPAIIHRARIVVDSVASFVIYDALAGRFGTDFFGEKGNFWRKN